MTKLLIVGQDQSLRAFRSEVLWQAGFESTESATTASALERFDQEPYGFVLYDCAAWTPAAADFCAQLKRLKPQTSILVIFASGLATDQKPGELENLADAILFEPVAPLQLISLARTLTRLYQAESRLAPAPTSNAAIGNTPSAELIGAQLTALYAASIDAVAAIDRDEMITVWNAAAERLFGLAADEALGKKLADIAGAPDTLTEPRQYSQRLRDGEPVEFQTIRTRKNGEPIEIWVRGEPVKGQDGSILGATFIIRDIAAQKQREQHVHFLMRELTHRSKNLLAVIQAMARQSLTHLNSPEDFVTRFSARLSGLAGSHDLLSNVNWEGASLIELIRSQLRHYEDRFNEKIHLEGPDLFLRPEAAQNIGIALHELSTNAAKYGALSVPDGNVSISWKVSPEKDVPRLQMMWRETGGPAVSIPSRKGFGHVVMDRITGQALGGTSQVEFNSTGVTWQLNVPAASVVMER